MKLSEKQVETNEKSYLVSAPDTGMFCLYFYFVVKLIVHLHFLSRYVLCSTRMYSFFLAGYNQLPQPVIIPADDG